MKTKAVNIFTTAVCWAAVIMIVLIGSQLLAAIMHH